MFVVGLQPSPRPPRYLISTLIKGTRGCFLPSHTHTNGMHSSLKQHNIFLKEFSFFPHKDLFFFFFYISNSKIKGQTESGYDSEFLEQLKKKKKQTKGCPQSLWIEKHKLGDLLLFLSA